jgi:hypothetical protein
MLHRSKRRNGIEQINIAYAMINYYKEKASTIKKWVPFVLLLLPKMEKWSVKKAKEISKNKLIQHD